MSRYVLDPDGPCSIRASGMTTKQLMTSARQKDRGAVQVRTLSQRYDHESRTPLIEPRSIHEYQS